MARRRRRTEKHELDLIKLKIDLARGIFVLFRFRQKEAFEAWRQLTANDCSVEDFIELIHYPEHTEYCQGYCTDGEGHDMQAAKRAMAFMR